MNPQFGDYLAATKRRVAAKAYDRRLSAARLASRARGEEYSRRKCKIESEPAPVEHVEPPPLSFGDYLAVARRRVDAANYIQRAAAVMATPVPLAAAVAVAEPPVPLPAIPVDPVREWAQAIADSLGYRAAVRAVTFLGEQFEPISSAEGARAARLTLEDGEVVMLGHPRFLPGEPWS